MLLINRKKGKSAGRNGLYMEALLYGGLRLWIHFSFFYSHVLFAEQSRALYQLEGFCLSVRLTLNVVMAIILRYFAEFGRFHS